MESENISPKYSCGESRRRSCDSISILVVDDDTTCLSFVAALLKKLKYEVVTAKHPNDALCALRIKGGAFDLVVSDVHMPDMNGFQLQQAITHEFNLPVVLMSVDSKEVVVSKGMKSGAAFFISKPVSPNDVKDLWKFVGMRKKRSHVVIEEEAIPEKTSKVGRQNKENSKRKPPSKEGCDSNNAKKPKVIWTNALHYRFLEAIRTIGLERSVPKKILEVMNVPGLTRENVASHLQKYRMFLKRVSDASYKLEFSNDEGLISRRSVSNYASSAASPSLLTLNSIGKPHFPSADNARFSSSSTSLIDQLSLPKPNITASNYERCVSSGVFDVSSSQIVSPLTSTNYIHQTSLTNYMGFRHLAPQSDISFPIELQDDMVNLDQQPQYLGVGGDYQDQLLPLPSDLSSKKDLENGGLVHEPEFCSMYNLPPFDLMDNFKAPDLDCPQINIQDLAQTISQQHGCDYNRSSLHDGMINSSYDQAFYQQVQGSIDNTATQFNTALESLYHHRGDDDFLESLLAFGAFGEDQIQTLEGT